MEQWNRGSYFSPCTRFYSWNLAHHDINRYNPWGSLFKKYINFYDERLFAVCIIYITIVRPVFPQLGTMFIATPGEVMGYWELHKYGKLPWNELFEPAIKLAEGFTVESALAKALEREESYILADPGLRCVCYWTEVKVLCIWADSRKAGIFIRNTACFHCDSVN